MNDDSPQKQEKKPAIAEEVAKSPKEIGGFEKKPEPTRFGDWDVSGRCSDF